MQTHRDSGHVLVLNGGSSAGKSSIARALQEILPGTWLTFGVDAFIDALPGGGDSPKSGIRFDSAGGVTVDQTFTRLEDAWYASLAAFVHAGGDVILDEALLSGAVGQKRLREAFAGAALSWVGVRCDPAVAAAREAARDDRVVGMAAQQATRVHAGVDYDFEVDTTSNSPDYCADEIDAFLRPRL